MGGFGHAVRFQHRNAECGFHRLHGLGCKRCAARTDEAQLADLDAIALSNARQQQLMHRGNGGIPRDAVLAHDAPEAERVKARRNDHGAAGSQRGHKGRHQSVNMEEWHHAERDVVGSEVVGLDNVADRRDQVGLFERHALRASGAAACMQNECDIIRRRPARCPVRTIGGEPHAAIDNADVNDRDGVAGGASRILSAVNRKHQQTGLGIFEVEAKLIFAIARIQWRRRPRHRRAEEADDGRQSVRKGHGHAVPARDAQPGKRVRHIIDLRTQRGIADPRAILGENKGRPLARDRLEQFQQGAGRRALGHGWGIWSGRSLRITRSDGASPQSVGRALDSSPRSALRGFARSE